MTLLAGLCFGQSDAADFRMAKSDIRYSKRVDGLVRLVRNFRNRNNALHATNVRQLRRSENDVANGVDARLGGLHPFVGLDEAALRLNPCLLQSNAVGVGLASDSDQNLFRFNLLLLAVGGERHRNSRFRLLDFLNLRIALKINAPLAID